MAVQIVRIDPYHPVIGLLVPFVAQRIKQMASEHEVEVDPLKVTQAIMARLWLQDPKQAVIALVDERGALVGHAVATIEEDGTSRWVFMHQTKYDPPEGPGTEHDPTAVKRGLEMAEEWGREWKCDKIVMATHRRPDAWAKKHGFTLYRSIMGRAIGQKEGSREE